MASPHHSRTVAAASDFESGECDIGDNVMPVRRDNQRRDGICHLHHHLQQQQQFAVEVGDHALQQSSPRAFRCTTCERQFANRKYLSMHMALHNTVSQPPPLQLVATSKRRVRTDSASDQWACPVCGKTFSQNSNFRNHVRTHSDQRPYVCLVCAIGFKERYHLKKHTLFKHSPGQLNEACRQCGKRFKDLTAVRAHERTHSEERPYACFHCHKTFKTSECLWHHENRSKTCGRAAATASRPLSSQCDETRVSTGCSSSSRRRQRCNRAAVLPTTKFDCRFSTTTADAAFSALPSVFVESSVAERSTALPPNVVRCASEIHAAAVASGVKPETEIAETIDSDISSLWTTTLMSDGVVSQSLFNYINFCRSTNSFDDLISTTTTKAAAVNDCCGDVRAVSGCAAQFWGRATPTDHLSESDHRQESSFVVSSSDAAFQTVTSYSEPLFYDTASGGGLQQSGTICEYDQQSIPDNCSTVTDAHDRGFLLKDLPSSLQAPLESVALSGSYLPTAVVTPIQRDRQRQHDYVLLSPKKTFHLPSIETFAPPRRP